ncbi:PAS domain-containing sensor histidine kinase [Microvirga terrestris]|uniref:PAS domain-containing protein n=1 Tax=Microvirga terrestris TaxID=2791024 RepID=A0ABS0HXV9_9HYPH|nr:PAS domain-containing protein [Microvirga terrestris]MBF9198277.1 PAS domain-containing protein [Microvirga terrestris]
MTAVGVQQPSRVRPRWAGMSLRWRVVVPLAFLTIFAFLAGAALLYQEATEDRHAIAHRAQAEAVAGSAAFDREVDAAGFLLQGLSRSPVLKSGDLRAFYDQLVETPHPEGSWFVLWDMNGQILNTIRPFGTRLPTRAEMEPTDEGYERIRTRGLSISNRVMGPVAKVPTVAVHLRLDDVLGDMAGLLTTVLPEARLNAVVREHPLPSGWTTIVLDRNFVPLAISDSAPGALPQELSPTLKAALSEHAYGGHFVVHDGVDDLLVGAQRSETTGFTTITTVPFAVANAPVDTAIQTITRIGLLLLTAGGLAGLVLVRQVGPVEATAAQTIQTARRLRLAEARYASLWNDTSESLFVVTVTPDGHFVFEGLNPAHERATGLSFEAIAGKEPDQCLPPDTAAAVKARYRDCLQSGAPMVYDEVLDFPGGRRHWQTSLAPVRDPETGTIVALVGTARDVTIDREATERIESSRRLLQATLDALSAHVAILDGSGRIVAVNKAWHRFAETGGYATPDHGIGADYVAVCRAASLDDPQAALVAGGLEAVLAGQREDFRLTYGCGDRFFQMTAARFCNEGTAHAVVAHEDVTELVAARRDVRDIAGRLLSLQEDERQRIAADLHDSTAQHIVAASLGLMHVERAASDLLGVKDAIDAMRLSLNEAQKEIRTLSYLLYPPSLRANGLAASLRRFVEGFFQRTGLTAKARVTGDVDGIPLDQQRAVLRVVQETLVNAYRHAEATKVSVNLRRDPNGLSLKITDNGKGMPARASNGEVLPPSLGVGIPGMEARIRQFDGTMTIESSAGGTSIRAWIPASNPAVEHLPLGFGHDRSELGDLSGANLRGSPDTRDEKSS